MIYTDSRLNTCSYMLICLILVKIILCILLTKIFNKGIQYKNFKNKS